MSTTAGRRRRARQNAFYRLAGLLGLVAYALDGLTDPTFREPVAYLQFWVTVGVSVALLRQARAPEVA